MNHHTIRIKTALLVAGVLAALPSCAAPTGKSGATATQPAVAPVAFAHPGVYYTKADLEQVKSNLDKEPWKSGYAQLAGDWHSSLDYKMQGPFEHVSRNPHVNRYSWMNDMQAISNLSRMWYFTGNTAYAQKAHDILLPWAKTQKSFTGIESNLDLGDYAYRFVAGADILRGTWPGWTQADTDAVKKLFADVYWPSTGLNGSVLGPGNKGGLSLSAGVAIAVFNDDREKLDKVLLQLRTFGSTGFQNTLSNGEHGETGRDQGHSYGQMLAMALIAEVLWKQGIDVFAERDNRLLAMGEYYARLNLGVPTPFVPMGTTDEYYMGIWDKPGYRAEPTAFTIMRNAYVLRKGLSAPWIERKLALQGVNMESFMFLRSADNSTAKPLAPFQFPGHSLVSTGLTNIDIGGAAPAGRGTYDKGIWTVQSGGTEIWTHGTEAFHFVYKQVTGDCAIIAKVNTVGASHPAAKAGVMMRSDLNPEPKCKAWVAVLPKQSVESYFDGWSEMYGGSNWEAQSYGISQPSWWVKIERVGNIITTYASPDGMSWATQVVARFDDMGSSPYVGLCLTSMVNGTPATATFSNLSITGGNGAMPVAAPPAPLAVYATPGDRQVPLRWSEAFGATSYKIKRATKGGGPYKLIATSTKPSYLDSTVSNSTTYYYVVSASNAAGEGADSPEDSVTPQHRLVNVAGNGTASASANPSGDEGADKAFDLNTGSKWFNGNAGTTGWIEYDLGTQSRPSIVAYEVISANDVPGRDPKDWQFQGSNDGSNWTTLDTQTGQSFDGNRFFAKRYFLAKPVDYRYYRLNITANDGDPTGVQLSELALLSSGDTPKPSAQPKGSTQKYSP